MQRNESLVNGSCALYVSVALCLILAMAVASPAQVNPKTDPGNNNPPPAGALFDPSGTPVPGGGNNTYQQYTVQFQATLANTTITIAFREDPAFISFANASVTDLTTPSGNLLINGDFSQGPVGSNSPTGWTYANQFGAFAGGVVDSGCGVGPAPTFSYGVGNCWFDGAVQAYDAISQTIATTPGHTYQISFFVADDSNCRCNFSDVSTNGNTTGTGGNGINFTVYAQAGLPIPAGGALWLGNDTVGDVFETNTTGGVLTDLPSLPTTGIAWDGNHLYFADPAGNFTKRTADGKTVLASFFVASTDTGEDLAWDSNRNVLWRIVHNNTLQKIDPVAHTVLAAYAIPTADATLLTLGGLGVAYDSTRDVLYVSYCEAGCGPIVAGLVDQVDPNTGNVMSHLFRTTGFRTGGLGYDPGTDTLWVGDFGVVRHMDRSGTVLSSFIRPAPPAGGFVDGLEFVPGTMTTQVVTTSSMNFTNFNMDANTVSVVFDNNGGQHVQGDAIFPRYTDLMFPAGIDATTFTLQEINRFVNNCQPYTIGTPFATCKPFVHAGNDAMAGTRGNGAKYEIICGDATHSPSEAHCPTPNTGKHIRFKDIFDLPQDTSGHFIQPAIAPGTTVSFLHWFPNTIPGVTSWSPSNTSPNPACTNVFTATFACDIEDALVNKYADSNGFGSDNRKGDYLLVYNIPMLTSLVKVNGTQVSINTPAGTETQGNSVFFVRSPLTFDFLVSPAQCNPALPVACGNGWIPAPVNNIFYTFDPLSPAPPDLPGATDFEDTIFCPGTNCPAAVPNGVDCPSANCSVTSGTPGAGGTNGNPPSNVEFTTTPLMNVAEGQYLLQWSAADTVKIRERNIQILTAGTCPNPFNDNPAPTPPCYSTKLFNVPITVDNKAPSVTNLTLTPNTQIPGKTITASYTCADNGNATAALNSGLASCGTNLNLNLGTEPGPLGPLNLSDTPFTVPQVNGPQTYNVTATDVAGNTFTATANYFAGYQFFGFLNPVQDPAPGVTIAPPGGFVNPVINVIRAGRTVPVAWQVLDGNGVGVTGLTLSAVNGGPGGTVVLTAQNSTVCAHDTIDNTILVDAAGNSGLQDLGGGNYQFNWKTVLPSGACVVLSVNPGDGTQHQVFFYAK